MHTFIKLIVYICYLFVFENLKFDHLPFPITDDFVPLHFLHLIHFLFLPLHIAFEFATEFTQILSILDFGSSDFSIIGGSCNIESLLEVVDLFVEN